MERVAPRQLLYENQLPVAIESTSTRRMFFPEGGSTYGPTGAGTNPNIIRIPINAQDMLDCQESYLQFKLTNRSTNAETLGLDYGVPFIRRLRIESGGTTLEDINEYGKLYAQLMACQSSQGAIQEATLTQGGMTSDSSLTNPAAVDRADSTLTNAAGTVAGAGALTHAELLAAVTAGGGADAAALAVNLKLANAMTAEVNAFKTQAGGVDAMTIASHGVQRPNTQLAVGRSVYFNVPLVSALLNMEKYVPLVMMNAGLVIEIELDDVGTAGVFSADAATCGWDITDVRYCAHLISLQRDFYDKLRLVMEGSGSVLQLSGTTYRQFTGTLPNTDKGTIAVPAKIKSIKGMLFTQNATDDKTHKQRYGVSNSIPNGISEYQFRVGSVVHPPTSVKVSQGLDAAGVNSYTNKGEAYQELRKLFGTLGDYQHGGVLINENTYLVGRPNVAHAVAGAATVVQSIINPFGLSFESFPRTALESGVNSADRNLSINLEITRNDGPAADATVNVWAMCDAIFYINLDGSVSASV